ncbi:MAG: TetR/AcrR family transcriptional regulator [Firmicutes bacterium]|jgi:AcrR family transcriptional regulator|nr:TetR/AcrR family transcriptional regulator [Bacillota bacterium]
MAKISYAERQENENRILEVSRIVFKEKGFKDAQMKDIAERAGLGTSTLYGYFPSKLELFIATFFENDGDDFISDEVIEENLELGLINGIIETMIMTVKLDTAEDFELIKSFFLFSMLENMNGNANEEFLGNRNDRSGLLLRVFEIYERKNVKLVPFSVISAVERILNSFTMALVWGLLFDKTDVSLIKAEVRKDLEKVFKGKYKEFQ